MLVTVKLDMSNAKASALLNYIKTLDFVYIDEKYTLSDAEKQAVEEGLASLDRGKKLTHEEVMNNMKKRFPNLF
jgi:hypothetical protein